MFETKMKELAGEYESLVNKMKQVKSAFEQLNVRKIQIEGALKELDSLEKEFDKKEPEKES